jgi:hypothetical protein
LAFHGFSLEKEFLVMAPVCAGFSAMSAKQRGLPNIPLVLGPRLTSKHDGSCT